MYLVTLVIFLTSYCDGCSYFSFFDYKMTLQETDTYTYDFWRYPPKNDFAKMDDKQITGPEEDLVDEAVMLIGGKFCKTVTCNITQDRTSYWDDKNDTLEERKLVGHDHTIKFFTQYGFCRGNVKMVKNGKNKTMKVKLPKMPTRATSLGAVALPDGRVLICGGMTYEYDKAQVRASDQTYCWTWTYRTNEIKQLEFYSKLPFRWLGPLTPSLMKLVHFKNKGTNETDVGGTKIEDFKDIHYTNKYDKNLEVSTFYRIIIIPWPSYTRAAWEVGKTSKNDAERMHNAKQARGEIIEGRIRITKYGSRIFWKRHILDRMPIGFGGCYVTQHLDDGKIRIHTFGGREMSVDHLGRDSGWMNDTSYLTKYPRWFDIDLESKSGNNAGYGNMTKNILLVQQKLKGMGSGTREVYVVRPNCGLSEQGRQQLHDTHNGDTKITNRRERDRELENDAKYLKLEEDRVFHTCHLLPRGLASTSDNEAESVIMVGGGSDAFNDRPAILAGLLRNEPMLSTVAKYKLSPNSECHSPRQVGNGHWVQQDRFFGRGLNIARSRHASEIIRTLDPITKKVKHTLWVFGGVTKSSVTIKGEHTDGKMLDSVESFDLSQRGTRFKIWDVWRHTESSSDRHESNFRLPWPTFDMTAVKIPVTWLPPECLAQYQRRKKRVEKGVPQPDE